MPEPRQSSDPPHPPFRDVQSRLRPAFAAAIVCFAAVTGTLLGFGVRSGAAWSVVNATAHVILGPRADGVWGFELSVTLAGVAVVLVMSAAAGIVAAWLASSRRTFDAPLSAFGVAVAGYQVHLHIVARTQGGLGALLTLGELRALYCFAAIALTAGMQYASASRVESSR